MRLKGGDTKTTTTQTMVAPYVEDAQKKLLNTGGNMLNSFLQAPSYAVAGLTPDHMMAYDLARQTAQQAFGVPNVPAGGYARTGDFDNETYEQSAARATNDPVQQQRIVDRLRQLNGDRWTVMGEIEQGAFNSLPRSATFQAPTAGFTSAGPAAQAAWQNSGPAAQAQFHSAGPAALAAAQQAQAERAGPAAQAQFHAGQAAQLGADEYKPFLNPYTREVVDTTIGKMRQENDRTQAGIGAQYAKAGAFGGSREAVRRGMQDQNFGEQVANTTAQLMARGYDQATSQAMANAQMRQQTGQQNTALQNQIGLANMGAQNAMRQFDVGQANDISRFNAQLGTNVGLQNAQAQNQMAQWNAGQQNNLGLQNAQAQNQLTQFNTAGANNIGLQNALAQNQMNQFNATGQTAADLANANRTLQSEQLRNQMTTAEQQRQMTALQSLLGIGDQQRAFEQQGLNVPWDMLQRLSAITPGQYPTTTNQTAPNTAQSPLQTLLGLGLTVGGMGIPGGGTLGGSLLSGLVR